MYSGSYDGVLCIVCGVLAFPCRVGGVMVLCVQWVVWWCAVYNGFVALRAS